MYWYSSKKNISKWLPLFLIAGLFSCKPDIKDTGSRYFDLTGYFKKDCQHLDHQNPQVTKTVGYNDHTETKKIRVKNWEKELELFSGSDINKPAWRQSYNIQEDSTQLTYTAKTPEVRTKLIQIKKRGDAVKSIYIINQEHNILYESTEKLTYVADSLYQIDKVQKVKFLGTNKYLIKGVIDQ